MPKKTNPTMRTNNAPITRARRTDFKTRTEGGAIPVTFILVAILYIGQQVWQAITVRDNVSYMAHIAGGAVGAGLGFVLNRVGEKS